MNNNCEHKWSGYRICLNCNAMEIWGEITPIKKHMNVQQQLSSLELSRKLKSLEVTQESEFYWESQERIKNSDGKWVLGKWIVIRREKGFVSDIAGRYGYSRFVSAFSVAELGELLKETEKINLGWGCWTEWNNIYKHWVCYLQDDGCEIQHTEEADTEANARAKMLIYLKEHILIK